MLIEGVLRFVLRMRASARAEAAAREYSEHRAWVQRLGYSAPAEARDWRLEMTALQAETAEKRAMESFLKVAEAKKEHKKGAFESEMLHRMQRLEESLANLSAPEAIAANAGQPASGRSAPSGESSSFIADRGSFHRGSYNSTMSAGRSRPTSCCGTSRSVLRSAPRP